MTRKHFESIAAAIKATRLLSYVDRLSVDAISRNVAHSLARHNERFDQDRFLKACGVEV